MLSTSGTITAEATETIALGRQVKLSVSGTEIQASLAAAGDVAHGVAAECAGGSAASGETLAVRLFTGGQIVEMVASGAISAGALVYAAASGKATATQGSQFRGVCLKATSNDGERAWVLQVPRPAASGRYTATAGDATNGYVEINTGLGTFNGDFQVRAVSSAGAARTVANVVEQATAGLYRVTITSLAANDVVHWSARV